MNKETRIKKIREVTSREPFGKQEIPWEDKLESMPTFKVPLEYLIYNKYNGRILSRTKSIEQQDQKINAETEEGKVLIEKLLWNSREDRNKKTLESIKKYGQEKVGIITRDGVIIDGNRRAMLLERAGYDYFKAVVLPDTLEDNQLEIEKLETTYQMGEDEKLGYNAIEKYLKTKGLFAQLTQRFNEKESIQKIAEWMGETESTIQHYLDVMKTMDDYLEYLEYDGIYTQLDGREDPFIFLTKWHKTFEGEQSSKVGWGYKNSDVDDLKVIAFDYIRAVPLKGVRYDGKRFRVIADGLKDKHFFGNKEIWTDFRDFHFEHIRKVHEQEEPIEIGSKNLQAHLNARDEKYLGLTKNDQGESFLDENLDSHYTWLRNKQASNEPVKLVGNAKRSLEAIDQKHKAFSAPDVMKQIEEVNKITTGMLKNKSPERLLTEIVDLLESVEIDREAQNKDDMLHKVAEINRISFELKKQLGG